MSAKRIDDLTDLTVQGIWEAHLEGELAEADVVDRVAVRAAGVLAEKGSYFSGEQPICGVLDYRTPAKRRRYVI